MAVQKQSLSFFKKLIYRDQCTINDFDNEEVV